MTEKFEKSVGKIAGAWGLHHIGFHNYPIIIYLHDDGRVEGKDDIKIWATTGCRLFLLDDKLWVKYVFHFKAHEETTVLLEGVIVDQPDRYLMRKCGEPHALMTFDENMPKANSVNFFEQLASRQDFSIEIEPRVEAIAPVEEQLTLNKTGGDVVIARAQPYSIPPVYIHVLNNAKIISGFIVEKSDGRCLKESGALSDINTAFDNSIHAYVDYEKELQFYPSVQAKDVITGLSIYIENGAGYGHWYRQSLPCILILEWLEQNGIDFRTVKLLFRRGFFNADHRAAFKAAGWLDKIPESSFIDLSKLSPTVAVEKLIYPSFMWIIIAQSTPPNYNLSLYSVTHRFKQVCDKIKRTILDNSPKRISIPLLYNMRKSQTIRKRLLNEDELIQKLEILGFVAVDPAEMDFEDKVRTFHSARIIIGAAGAGMGHAAFCEPGAHVHELCPHSNDFLYDQHKTLCVTMDLKYSCTVYPVQEMPDDADHLSCMRCFYVDIAEVVENMKKILARPEFADLGIDKTKAA